MIFRAFLSAIVFLACVGSAAALTPQQAKQCRADYATLKTKRGEVTQAKEALDAAAMRAETLGEAWENAEALRSFGPDNAAQADKAKQAYQDAKTSFEAKKQVYERITQGFNALASDFSERCAKD